MLPRTDTSHLGVFPLSFRGTLVAMPETPEEAGKHYRAYIEDAARESQRNYDRTLITLAGGALGLSFALLDKLASPHGVRSVNLLVGAWISWSATLLISLFAFLMSRAAFVSALKQLYGGNLDYRNPGGRWARLTVVCNILAGFLFFLGVVLIALFTLHNLETIGHG